MNSSRRRFLVATTGAAGGAFGASALIGELALGAAQEIKVAPELVRLRPEIEPLVQLIERTPREACVAMAALQLKEGVPYREFLAALFLAGIRNVNPQPPGFKFHCVFAIHAAHQLALDAPVAQRLWPLFWALDEFKSSQQRDVDEGDFRLSEFQGEAPSGEQAWPEFHAAMDAWDESRAERAVVGLVRSKGAMEIVEGLWQYGARDYRNIGHKAIFVANAWRTLETIGWQHAEPVLRSLVRGLLDFGKDENVNGYAFENQAYLPNAARAREAAPKLPGDWSTKPADEGATREVLSAIRSGDLEGACRATGAAIAAGSAGAQSVWDAVHLAAGELMMRQPGIYGIHTVTSANALAYAFRTSGRDETRFMLLLQGVGWMTQFRNFMATARGGLSDVDITAIGPAEIPDDPREAAQGVLADVGVNAASAAAKALAFAKRWPDEESFMRAARNLVVQKGTDAHDYKYAAAIFEELDWISPAWRPHALATATYHLRGAGHPDSAVVAQARAALEG